jgi:hypothetical protein
MDAIGWKYFAIYCGWIFFEFLFQFTFYPETQGRTLEELAFCESCPPAESVPVGQILTVTVFEDKHLADQTTQAVEKQIVSRKPPFFKACR